VETVVKYYVKTEKGYLGGKVSGDTYEMEKKAISGWHTYNDFRYEKIKWVDDIEDAKEIWINTMKTFAGKIDDLIDMGLEDIKSFTFIVVDDK